jgi:hypothetical protein
MFGRRLDLMLLKSKDTAYLGVLLGLNQIFVILSSVIETNTIMLFAAAALVVGIVVVEFGGKSAFVFYVASCTLGFFLTFNKVEVITYIMFFGLYSIAKHLFEAFIKNKKIQYAAKLIFFNVSLAAMFFTVRLFITLYVPWWMFVAAQAAFLVYDYAFTIFINQYIEKVKPKIKRN